jgi:hypothetical protein
MGVGDSGSSVKTLTAPGERAGAVVRRPLPDDVEDAELVESMRGGGALEENSAGGSSATTARAVVRWPLEGREPPLEEGEEADIAPGSSIATATAPGLVAWAVVRRCFPLGDPPTGDAATAGGFRAPAGEAGATAASGSSFAGTDTAPGAVAGAVRRGLPPLPVVSILRELDNVRLNILVQVHQAKGANFKMRFSIILLVNQSNIVSSFLFITYLTC